METTDQNNDQSKDDLILKFLNGRLTETEKTELEKWLSDKPSNREYFKHVYRLWKASAITGITNEEIESAFQKVQIRAFRPEKKNSNFAIRFGRWAAIFLLLVSVGFILFHVIQKNNGITANNGITVPLGSKSMISLPDGSEVWLNAGSNLTYSTGFGNKTREVTLTGEGYFKVAKNPKKPFIVHTSKMDVKALGTEFNVKAYPDDNIIETILVEGSVEVKKFHDGNTGKVEKVILQPGEKAKIYKNPEDIIKSEEEMVTIYSARQNEKRPAETVNKINLQPSDTQVETSWKDDRWIIKGESLDNLSLLLARRFNISIVLLDEKLTRYKFSGTIENETLDEVFKIMSLTIPMSYTVEKGKATVALNKKLENKYQKAYGKGGHLP